MFENGVEFYEKGILEIPIYFPEGHISCQYCRLFCRYEDAFQRYSCRLTDEWLMDVKHNIGASCPLNFDKKEENIPF